MGHLLIALLFLVTAIAISAVYFHLFRLGRLNAISVMLISHLVIQVGPAFLFYFNTNLPATNLYLLSACVSALLIPIGALLADLPFPDARRTMKTFYAAQFEYPRPLWRRVRRFVRLILIIGLVMTAIYVTATPGWPVLELITGSAESHSAFMQSRRDASVLALGYPFAAAKLFLMPFSVAVAAAWLIKSRRLPCVPYWTLFGIVVMALVYNSYSGATTGVATLAVVAVFVAWHRLVQDSELKVARYRRWMFVFGAIALALTYPVIIGFIKPIGEHGLTYILWEEIFARVTTKPALNTYYAFELFPGVIPYTWFSDIGDIAALTGREFVNTGQLVSIHKGQGPLNQAPPAALGTFYAQGGWPIVVLGYIFAGALFRLAENLIIRSRYKTPVEVGMHALLLFGAFRLAWSKFHYILLTETLVPIFLIIVVWYVLKRRIVIGQTIDNSALP